MLTKSDYKTASSCIKKLVYKKARYKTKDEGNEYLKLLANGGHVINKYAQLLYPEGREIFTKDPELAAIETKKLFLENDNITLFEGTFTSNERMIRADIIEKKDNTINLIEVKSKSFDSVEMKAKDFEDEILDVTFQALVISEIYPDYKVNSYLLMPDKSKFTNIDGLAGWFSSQELNADDLKKKDDTEFAKKITVKFKFDEDPERENYILQLKEDSILTLYPLNELVSNKSEEVIKNSIVYLDVIKNGVPENQFLLSKNCASCEYNLGKELIKNGYRECWKDLTDVSPNIFDLNHGGSIGSAKKGFYYDELIRAGSVSLFDIDQERLKTAKGEISIRGIRQIMQIENTHSNSEVILPEFKSVLEELKYPLHFIDFETYSGAIPHHKGMRPYEKVAFQWSCHTIDYPGADPVHSEFLNEEYDFPNFRFAKTLMAQIGESGTPFMWSPFENTILRDVLHQIESQNHEDEILKNWLLNITTDKDAKPARKGRFVDLNALANSYYFHPDMKGKTSIKKVLPAIWNNNPYLHDNPWFSQYVTGDALSSKSLYDSLAPIINEMEEEEVINEGTGAMRYYNEMMFGLGPNDQARKEQLKTLLLQYCELDTMAMVIVWRYWVDKLNRWIL